MNDPHAKTPTKASLSKLIGRVLRIDAHINAFCVNHFPDVAAEFSSGMLRADKLNLLLQLKKPTEILERLREHHPEDTAQHSELLIWESDSLHATSARVRSTVPPELRDQLLEIAGTAVWALEDLCDAYYVSAPPEWRYDFDHDHDADLISRMIVKLATALGQSDAPHPILRFSLHLIKLATAIPNLRKALFDWFVTTAGYFGLSAPAQRALQEQVEHSAPAEVRTLHLVIVMRPHMAPRDHYAVRAFRVLARREADRWLDGDVKSLSVDHQRSYSLDEMPALVNDLLMDLIEDLRRSKNELTIELVVPLALLGCDADRWELALGIDLTVPLGVEHTVVIRSWERAYDPRCRGIIPRWEAKWRRVHSDDRGVAWACAREDAVCGIAPKLHAQGPACVVLGFSPPRDTMDGCAAVLKDIIASGTPVAVWSREQPPDDARLGACVQKLAAATPPHAWPIIVKGYRCEAHGQGDTEHPGHHLTILWDNPNKLPPDARPNARLTTPRG